MAIRIPTCSKRLYAQELSSLFGLTELSSPGFDILSKVVLSTQPLGLSIGAALLNTTLDTLKPEI